MAIYRQGNEFSDLPFSAEQIQRDLGKLQTPEAPVKPLPPAATPAPIADKTALAKNTPSASGGGISSPLAETNLADRTYHDGKYITTGDGLFAWPAVKSMKFKDASGRDVVIQFAAPA